MIRYTIAATFVVLGFGMGVVSGTPQDGAVVDREIEILREGRPAMLDNARIRQRFLELQGRSSAMETSVADPEAPTEERWDAQVLVERVDDDSLVAGVPISPEMEEWFVSMQAVRVTNPSDVGHNTIYRGHYYRKYLLGGEWMFGTELAKRVGEIVEVKVARTTHERLQIIAVRGVGSWR